MSTTSLNSRSVLFTPADELVHVFDFAMKPLFVVWLAGPMVAVLLAVVVGYAAYPTHVYAYFWGCRDVFLPSISRLLNFPLGRIAWNLLALGQTPLIVFVLVQQVMFLGPNLALWAKLVRLVLLLSAVTSTVFLTLLATVGERESGILHVVFFCGFATSTVVNAAAFTLLTRFAKSPNVDEKGAHLQLRGLFGLCLCVCLPTIILFFILHNVSCVPAAYELFATFEYLTVFCICGFQVTGAGLMTGHVVVAAPRPAKPIRI